MRGLARKKLQFPERIAIEGGVETLVVKREMILARK